jgi:putative endonuclease
MSALRATLSAWLRRLFPEKPLDLRGEEAAARYLKRFGYRILARRDRTELGELDLVALDGDTLVFIEVKTRDSADVGHPAEAVDAAKQRRLTRLAVAWLKRRRLLGRPARFDVVAVVWPKGERRPRIEHIPNAFQALAGESFFA